MRAVTLFVSISVLACGDRAEPSAEKPAAATKPTGDQGTAKSRVVNLPLGDDLPRQLTEHAALAKEAKLTPFVELWAEWCGPCKKLEAAMGDPRIEKAFTGVYLIRLDSDQWGPKLEGTGLDGSTIPVFYELDANGKTTGRKIDGGAWGEDIPENMAPPLDAFFHGAAS